MFENVPYGYCHCGCGAKTSLVVESDKRYGAVKGEPRKYLVGHNAIAPIEVRFWSKVDKSGECWLWTGCKNPKGYGNFHANRKTYIAHRMAWILANGEIPADMLLLHKCDNPGCVNPNHLTPGTNQENMTDKTTKGRVSSVGMHGEKHPMSKLTSKQAEEIRLSKETGAILSERFGVTESQISKIKNKQGWNKI